MAKLTGADLLRKKFKILREQGLGRNGLRAAARAGARIVQLEAKRIAPKRTGQGAKGIIVIEKRSPVPDQQAIMAVGFRRENRKVKGVLKKGTSSFYLMFFETGVAQHVISVFKSRVPSRKNFHYVTINGKTKKVYERVRFRGKRALFSTPLQKFFGTTVIVRGFAKRPILQPALQAKASEAASAMAATVRERIRKAVQGAA